MEIITTIEQLEALESNMINDCGCCSMPELIAGFRAALEREAAERKEKIEYLEYINQLGHGNRLIKDAFG